MCGTWGALSGVFIHQLEAFCSWKRLILSYFLNFLKTPSMIAQLAKGQSVQGLYGDLIPENPGDLNQQGGLVYLLDHPNVIATVFWIVQNSNWTEQENKRNVTTDVSLVSRVNRAANQEPRWSSTMELHKLASNCELASQITSSLTGRSGLHM